MRVPFFSPTLVNGKYKEALDEAYNRVLNSNQLILGNEVATFEEAYANYIGTKYCVGVSNGLDALVLSLKACGVGVGDEVLVQANTCSPTIMAITLAGATPVFFDITQDLDVEEELLEKFITPNTKAIVPVHLYGRPFSPKLLLDVTSQLDLILIEDNAQATGAEVVGQKTGSFGLVNAHSFYPTKTLGALGDAGAITTNDEEIYHALKMLRNYGAPRKNQHDAIGHNCRLDELQAAFLNVKLKSLDADNAERKRLAGLYIKLLSDIQADDFHYSGRHPHSAYSNVFHLFVISVSKRRDELQQYLAEQGIETQIHYPTPPHLQKAFAYLGYKKGDFPMAERHSERTLSLPLFPGMPDEWVVYTANCVRQFYGLAKI